MNILPTSLMSEAQKILRVTQESYKTLNRKPNSEYNHEKIITQISKLNQNLFEYQSGISEKQMAEEGLKEIILKLDNLYPSYNDKQVTEFYKDIFDISKKYSYNQNELISLFLPKGLYERNLQKEDIILIGNNIKKKLLSLEREIDKDKKKISKIQVSSENILASSTMNKDLFASIKKELDNKKNSSIIKESHLIISHDHISHLLENPKQ